MLLVGVGSCRAPFWVLLAWSCVLAAKTSRAARCRAVLAKRIHEAASKQGGNKAFMPMDVTCSCPAPASFRFSVSIP